MPDMDHSGRLELPYILPAQAQKHITHNEALRMLDAIVQLTVQEFDRSAPPATGQDGDIYVVGPTPTGEWAGQGGKLAYHTNGGWMYLAPREGWIACDLGSDGLRVFRAGSWHPLLQGVDRLGVGTAADATNRLAVASEATLFSHAGADHRLKVNKAATDNTASLLFQSGWSGRAELGLTGSDAFAIKVSPDGSSFLTALTVDPTNGTLGGSAITETASDLTAGRLLKVGAGAGQLDPALYSRSTVLGNVAHMAGQPTGALFERGSNANGNYLRFADGTQICSRKVQVSGLSINTSMGSLYRANVGDFAFPAVFSVVDAVGVTLMGSQNASIRNTAGVLKTRQGSSVSDADWTGITLWSSASITGTASETTNLSLFAIGRWF